MLSVFQQFRSFSFSRITNCKLSWRCENVSVLLWFPLHVLTLFHTLTLSQSLWLIFERGCGWRWRWDQQPHSHPHWKILTKPILPLAVFMHAFFWFCFWKKNGKPQVFYLFVVIEIIKSRITWKNTLCILNIYIVSDLTDLFHFSDDTALKAVCINHEYLL